MGFKKATGATTRINLDTDWLEVRTDIPKRARNQLVAYLPNRQVSDEGNDKLTIGEAVELQTGLFAALVVAWSAEQPCTVEEYLSLEPEDADRIDEALAKHWTAIQPTKEEAKAAFRDGGSPREGTTDGDTAAPTA